MDGEIIGCSDRGTFSSTLTDEVKDMLNQMNQGDSGNSNGSNNGSNNAFDDNHITSGGQEKPPYFHPPYVI